MEIQKFSEKVLFEKYADYSEQRLSGSKLIDALRRRVAVSLASVEKDKGVWAEKFYEAQVSGLLMGGRINAIAGVDNPSGDTMINCFVQPVSDTLSGYEDGRAGIFVALDQAVATMRKGGGVGYDFGYIRPKGAEVGGSYATAAGPVSYMKIFDSACKSVISKGHRRSAQMGVLPINHPDIREFISAKNNTGILTQFNLSVAVDDSFMRALKEGDCFQLVHKAKPSIELIERGAFMRDDGMWVYEEVDDPASIWNLIMTKAFRQSEPGVIFVDRINSENNLQYIEQIGTTNPCGEQPLPDYGCCCLASINLSSLVLNPFSMIAPVDNFNWEMFRSVVRTSVRMLDNVLSVSNWPLNEQRNEAFGKRRIGLGITCLGSALILLGLRYDSHEGRQFANKIAVSLRDEAYLASVELAKEKGVFPLFSKDQFLNSDFIKRLPVAIQHSIACYGIRNSHLLSIAPAGTISLALADNGSSGIEPVFGWQFSRNKRMENGEIKTYLLEEYAYRLYVKKGGSPDDLPNSFVDAMHVSPEDHLGMVEAFSKYIDGSISKTINCSEDICFEAFKGLYLSGYYAGIKGVTMYRPNSITGSVMGDTEPSLLEGHAESKYSYADIRSFPIHKNLDCAECGNNPITSTGACNYCIACGSGCE